MQGYAEGVRRTTRKVLPGLLLASAVGLAAHVFAERVFPYALAIGFEVPLAMLAGLILVNVGLAPAWATPGISFAVQRVLRLGIILLGLRLNLESILVIGAGAFGLVLVGMAVAFAFAIFVGRSLGLPKRVAVLIGVGTAVCGNSAIVATAPVVKANDREVSFAVTTITVFGTLAVFVYPVIGHALELDVLTFGLWAGTAVHDTAQTIAASAAYSTIGRDVATVVKLVRNGLMAPLLLLIAWGWTRWGEDTVSGDAARRGARKAFPLFLIGFLLLALARTTHLVDPDTAASVDIVTRACFVIALAGLGLQTRLGHIRDMGPRPFVLGLATAGVLAGFSLVLILGFGLGPARTRVEGGADPRAATRVWAPVCSQGAAAAFAGAFVALARQIPTEIGTPSGCAEVDPATGDTIQRTSLGVARFAPATGLTTFSNAQRTWSSQPSEPLAAQPDAADVRNVRVTGRLLATGIPGAGAVAPVGTFHTGGPMRDKREFSAMTQAGQVLERTRLLVASTSNFGAPLARPDWAPGAILSLATDAPEALTVPAEFAAAGVQARALDGAVQLYTAQSPAFLNRLTAPQAETADMPAVSNPTGISINNAFGRPWFANAPLSGGSSLGLETVLDPDGRPLANAPSWRAGGAFAGGLTNRAPQRQSGGLQFGAIGNALLGGSPDGTNRAVFAVATTDGGLVQVNVEHGVDGLAPPGTLAPAASRVGMVFNWVPDRFLYVADPGNDAVLQLHLRDDFLTFQVVESRRLESAQFSEPVDLAPAVPEIANPAFSSNTTLAGGADLYVANRGSGTIARVRQDGRIIAVAEVEVAGMGILGADELNGIAVSPDASKIWLTLNRPGQPGAIVELPAFGASD
jgi:uncharacterized integral membrane protein (TIGR00698 family)